MNTYKLEMFKLRYVFGALIGIELLLDFLAFINIIHIENGIDTIYSFWQMISWLFIVGYCVWDFYKYFYLCKDTMLLLSPESKDGILKKKGVVYFGLMMLYFGFGLARFIVLSDLNMPIKLQISAIYLISKIVAVISFLSLLVLLLFLTKKVHSSAVAFFLLVTLGGIVIGLQAYFLCSLVTANSAIAWIIGVVDGNKGINNYANIMPIVFINEADGSAGVKDSFYSISVFWNAIVAAVSVILSKILYRSMKFDFVAK